MKQHQLNYLIEIVTEKCDLLQKSLYDMYDAMSDPKSDVIYDSDDIIVLKNIVFDINLEIQKGFQTEIDD